MIVLYEGLAVSEVNYDTPFAGACSVPSPGISVSKACTKRDLKDKEPTRCVPVLVDRTIAVPSKILGTSTVAAVYRKGACASCARPQGP